VLLSDDQIEELSSAIKMKLGHKLKFVVAVKAAREEKEEQERKAREDKEEQERKRRREKEEQEEQKELERELSKIERKRILRDAEARSTRDADNNEHADAKPKATETTENNKATDPAQYQASPLPDWKDYAAFISHVCLLIYLMLLSAIITDHFFIRLPEENAHPVRRWKRDPVHTPKGTRVCWYVLPL
jgi:hypothetical protein